MDSILNKISLIMLNMKIIQENEYDIVHYGLELFMLKVLHFGGIFLPHF